MSTAAAILKSHIGHMKQSQLRWLLHCDKNRLETRCLARPFFTRQLLIVSTLSI